MVKPVDQQLSEASELICFTVDAMGNVIQLKVPERGKLLHPWLPERGLAMVYAKRGVGKTYFGLAVAYAVATGGKLMDFHAPAPRRALYIDGEMPLKDLQDRLKALGAPTDNLRLLTFDRQKGPMVNIADLEHQSGLEASLADVDLIVADNLSTLVRHEFSENSDESWNVVQEWAIKQRSLGRTVLFVHHAGQSGNQRGTTKREDVLDTSIELRHPADYSPEQGARFEIHFKKTRGFYGPDAAPVLCELLTKDGVFHWHHESLEESTFSQVVRLYKDGWSQVDISKELDRKRSTIHHHVQKAEALGLVSPKPGKKK